MGSRNSSSTICFLGFAVVITLSALSPTTSSVAVSPSSGGAAAPTPSPRYTTLSNLLKEKKEIVKTLAFLGLSFFISGSIQILHYFWRKSKGKPIDELDFDVSFGDEFGLGPRDFSCSELCKATKIFDDEYKLGEGGFGAVYRGFLKGSSNIDVAVKRFWRKSKQGIKEYTTEVKIISQLRHKNLVKLLGWCHKKELLLVYEFMPNGSLDTHLFKGRSLLPWDLRYRIVLGLASAMLYLHEEGDFCVLHRDIKASNIMLDSAYNAKLGDFGLARIVDHERGAQTTQLAGTWGYMAPECHNTGKATKESDVYSFGVVVLEIVCGRRSIEPGYEEDQESLVDWVWEAFGNQRLLDVVDKKLGANLDLKEMECLIMVGLWCTHPVRSMRPSVRHANQVLKFETPFPNLPNKKPAIICDHTVGASVYEISGEPCLSYTSITIPR